MPGYALGQSQQSTIEDCKAQCEGNPDCNSFMYGGFSSTQNDLCEIAAETVGTNSWGTNLLFCTKQGNNSPFYYGIAAKRFFLLFDSIHFFEFITYITIFLM